jgi:hypothetical protein
MPISDRDRRMLRIGGIVVGVLVVGFLLLKLLGGGGEEEAFPSSSPLKPASSTTQPTGTPSLTPSPVLVLPARDPFSIPPGFETTTSSSGGSSTTSSSGGSSTSSSSGGSSTTGTTTAPPTQPGNGASKTVGGHTVVLLDTFTANGVEQAQVEVDGTVYDPSVGQTFGPNKQYRLQSVSGNCATFLYGDESFTLCVSPNK